MDMSKRNYCLFYVLMWVVLLCAKAGHYEFSNHGNTLGWPQKCCQH